MNGPLRPGFALPGMLAVVTLMGLALPAVAHALSSPAQVSSAASVASILANWGSSVMFNGINAYWAIGVLVVAAILAVIARGSTVKRLARAIRREYQASNADTELVDTVVANMASRDVSDLANAVPLRLPTGSPKLQKAFLIGRVLSVTKKIGATAKTLELALNRLFNTEGDVAALKFVSSMDDVDSIPAAVEALQARRSKNPGSKAALAVIITREAPADVAERARDIISQYQASDIAVGGLNESKLGIENGELALTALFAQFSVVFQQQASGKDLFERLAADQRETLMGLRVAMMGQSTVHYIPSENLLSMHILFSLIPLVGGGYLIQDLSTVLLAAKMA